MGRIPSHKRRERGYPHSCIGRCILGHFGAVGGIIGFHDQYDNVEQGDDIPGIMRTVGDFTMSSLLGLIRDERAPFFSRARAAQSQLWSDLEHRSFSGVSVLRDRATTWTCGRWGAHAVRFHEQHRPTRRIVLE